jgi:hypothetical protein
MNVAERLSPVAPDAPVVEFALDYARRGWHVFPCRPQDKRPYTVTGFKDATTSDKQVRAWWSQWPRAMIGVRMGAASGVWAIDPDAPKQNGDPDGQAAWARLIAEHGAIHTHAHLTPGDGQHVLFAWDAERPVTNKEGDLRGTGINVRGEGGYIIAPPSRRQDGKAYDVAEPLDFFRFAKAPDWLYDLILAKPVEASISQRAMSLVQSRNRDRRPYAEAALRGECEAVAGTVKDRNVALNNAAIKLGSLVGAGELSEGEVIGALYDAASACGYVASDGQRATMNTINSGLQAGIKTPRQIPARSAHQPASQQDQAQLGNLNTIEHHPSTVIHATPYAWRDPATITKREWLYGYLLIRKFVSATVSPGGVGKSSLIAVEALAMTSGRSLLEVSPPSRLRVWLWNLEDPQEETERKVQAAALYYRLTPDDVADRLYVDSGRDQPLVIATAGRNGAMIARPVVDCLIAEIIRREIDVVVIDPFVSSHEVSENDNTAMDMIVKEWGKVAERGNCAIHLVHHTRKMTGVESEVTTDSSRGGKALTDGCRVVRAVNRMSKEEADRAGVDNHRLYFRTFNDKANLQPPADQSDWFRLHSVDLGNGTLPGRFGGDSIGVVSSWRWPDPLAEVTAADFEMAARAIRAGRWRENIQSKDWVGRAVAQAMDLNIENKKDKAKVSAMIKAWLSAGSLIVVDGEDDKRMVRKFVEVREEA